MTSQCFDIVRRSDAEDGAVPPEPVGPMEVAPRRTLNALEISDSPNGGAHLSVRWQPPSEIVSLYLSGTTSLDRVTVTFGCSNRTLPGETLRHDPDIPPYGRNVLVLS